MIKESILRTVILISQMDFPLISIIIPAYNVSEYIAGAVDSALAQTYPNIEIIVVNDGSNDGGKTKEILMGYGSDISYYEKPNGGLSSTRNYGVEKASGQYIMFLDGDDWLSPDICEALYSAMTSSGAQIAMCSYMKEYPDYSVRNIIFGQDRLFFGEEFKEGFYRRIFGLCGEELRDPSKADTIVPSWGKLFPADVCKGCEFVSCEKIGTEDALFLISALTDCDSLAYVEQPLYHYRKFNAQSLTSVYKPRLYSQWKYLFSLIQEKIIADKLPESFQTALDNRVALSIIGLGLNEVRSKDKSLFKKSKALKTILEDELWVSAYQKLSFQYFPLKWKIFFILAKKRRTILLSLMLTAIEHLKKHVGKGK